MIIVRGPDRWFVRKYVCACCWGDLGVELGGDPDQFYCLKGPDRCSGKGFVTRDYALTRLEASHYEREEVIANYPQLAPPRIKLTEKQILHSLGF